MRLAAAKQNALASRPGRKTSNHTAALIGPALETKGTSFKGCFFERTIASERFHRLFSQREGEGRYLPIPSAQFTISQLQLGAVREDRSLKQPAIS